MVLFSVIYTEAVIQFPLSFCFAKLNKPRISTAKHAPHSSGQPFFPAVPVFGWMPQEQ